MPALIFKQTYKAEWNRNFLCDKPEKNDTSKLFNEMYLEINSPFTIFNVNSGIASLFHRLSQSPSVVCPLTEHKKITKLLWPVSGQTTD